MKMIFKFFLAVFFIVGNGILLTEDLSEMHKDLWLYVVIALIIDAYYIYKFVKKAYEKNQEKAVAQRKQREIAEEENRRQEQIRKEEEKKRKHQQRLEQCKRELEQLERDFNGRDCVLNLVCLIENCSGVNFETHSRMEFNEIRNKKAAIENKRNELGFLMKSKG